MEPTISFENQDLSMMKNLSGKENAVNVENNSIGTNVQFDIMAEEISDIDSRIEQLFNDTNFRYDTLTQQFGQLSSDINARFAKMNEQNEQSVNDTNAQFDKSYELIANSLTEQQLMDRMINFFMFFLVFGITSFIQLSIQKLYQMKRAAKLSRLEEIISIKN